MSDDERDPDGSGASDIEREDAHARESEDRGGGDGAKREADEAEDVDDWTAPELQYSPAHLALMVLVAGGALVFVTWGTPLGEITGKLALVAWPGIPVLIYYDARQIMDRTEWETELVGWIVGGLVPVVNISVGLVYLLERHIRIHDVNYAEASRIWFLALIVSIALPIASVPVGLLTAATVNGSVGFFVGFTMFFYGLWIAPLVVYLDAEYVEELCEWDPFEELWALFTLLVPVFGATVYLLRRSVSME